MAKAGIQIENLVAAFGRLSKRERYMVSGVAALFVLFVTFMIGLWVSSSLGGLERQIETKTKQLQKLIDVRQEFELAKDRLKKAERQIRQGKNIQLMSTIEENATKLGVNIENMQERTPTVNPEANVTEDKVEVNIKLITIDRLVDFLKAIERKSDTIAVRKLHIKQSFQQPDQLEVGFTVSNFKLIKEKAPAPEPRKPKAGKAEKSSRGSTTSKPGPRAQPKGK
jgi:type II secretory pathway component PulM